jgi:chorismate synthase
VPFEQETFVSSTFRGSALELCIFGESHGAAIGMTLDGLPSGEPIDHDELAAFMARRAPDGGVYSTARHEGDKPRFLSGLKQDKTCGTPLVALIENHDAHSADYEQLRWIPRPGHVDFTAWTRFGDAADLRGGGHYSGRLTAPLCLAGGIALQMLSRRGIEVGSHLLSVGEVSDQAFDPVNLSAAELHQAAARKPATLDSAAGADMLSAIAEAAAEGDSLGGVVECAALGLPIGLGEPLFDGIENQLARLVFAIPAVRGIEFGSGFQAACLRGSEHNDDFCVQDGRVRTLSNNHGGVLGGMASGMPLIFRVAFKPTPSIAREQQSVDLRSLEPVSLSVPGRHDPCLAVRAVACVEAACALALLDLLLSSGDLASGDESGTISGERGETA